MRCGLKFDPFELAFTGSPAKTSAGSTVQAAAGGSGGRSATKYKIQSGLQPYAPDFGFRSRRRRTVAVVGVDKVARSIRHPICRVRFRFDQVFDTMERAHWHVFQILTKRSSLMTKYLQARYGRGRGPQHVWCGVSVEDAQAKSRIAHLQSAPAGMRFLSLEPLLGALSDLNLTGINWVIVGGESGPGARPMDADWVRQIRDQCLRQGVAFFFKQWGGIRPKAGGRALDDREWSQFPCQPKQLAAAE